VQRDSVLSVIYMSEYIQGKLYKALVRTFTTLVQAGYTYR